MFLADGFETVEALAPADVMRRAGINVVTVSIMGRKTVSSAHGINVEADTLFGDSDYSDADALVLPGGSQGTENLSAFEPLRTLLAQTCEAGRIIAAICAAPMVFGRIGLLAGRRATCYPGCEADMGSAIMEENKAYVVDGKIITGTSAGCAIPFGLALVTALKGSQTAEEVATQIVIR